ncbi:MAG: di-trans,poly-cis-decaprenylcistransferase [Alistipes sp.]|nr:di-trans,poly-cis-decaprenylcistransferase [Alistipes sp.]
MDGNGRWAKLRGKERSEGHVAGMEALRRTIQNAAEAGVKYLTVYAFSTENWGRPKQEVEALMALICRGVELEADNLREAGVRVKVMGRRENFSAEVAEAIRSIEEQTAAGEQLTLILALDYSSRSEICDAVRNIARRVQQGELAVEQIDEHLISESLLSAGVPDPDLVIRTSGEYRLSNFLLWQASYAELYFTDVLWPDFDGEELQRALEAYAARERRYGLVK